MSPEEPDTTERWPASRRLALAALVVTLIAGAALVFLPIGWQINRFIVWLYYRLLSAFGWSPFSIDGWAVALNVLLFVVPTLLAAVVWPRIQWWLWAVLGFLASGTVELAQMACLPREASFTDWVANGSGALLGALAAHFLTHGPRQSLGHRSREQHD